MIGHEDIEHPKEEMDALTDSGSKFAFLFLPGETGVWSRRFFCSVCEGCRGAKWATATDPMKGKTCFKHVMILF